MECYTQQNLEEKQRVLVVDDEVSLRKILYRILEQGGYSVLSASSGDEAVAICRRSSPPLDLLITDYNMPGMNGLDVGRQCAAFNCALPVLYISGGNLDEAFRAECEKQQRGFLAKPFRGEELLRKVKEMLLMRPELTCPAQQLSL